MKEKRRQWGLNAESKTLSFLVILISVPVGLLILCMIVFIANQAYETNTALKQIQVIIEELCNLPDYEANSNYYTWRYSSYVQYLDNEKLEISCESYSGEWQCTCTETD